MGLFFAHFLADCNRNEACLHILDLHRFRKRPASFHLELTTHTQEILDFTTHLEAVLHLEVFVFQLLDTSDFLERNITVGLFALRLGIA